ncbi:MAG: hypothetical protein QOF78_344 [Phycisphaerales bacterium]|jgi:hypothetical protein|nr:hypothetical protein [Phycisphaerales bacterium]
MPNFDHKCVSDNAIVAGIEPVAELRMGSGSRHIFSAPLILLFIHMPAPGGRLVAARMKEDQTWKA